MINVKKCCSLGRCIATTDLKACAGCNEAFYCTRDHQIEAFKECGHKFVCPGRKNGDCLTFQQCVERATNYYGRILHSAIVFF